MPVPCVGFSDLIDDFLRIKRRIYEILRTNMDPLNCDVYFFGAPMIGCKITG